MSALIILVPAADPVVAHHRHRLDTAASWGVSAHITVLVPFVAPHRIDDTVLTAVGEVVAAVPAFDLTLSDFGWFGDTVLYLAPEPDAPIRALTAAVHARFPDHPPYEGAHDEVVPHLTIGHDHPYEQLTAARDDLGAHLPIRQHVGAVHLITGRPEPGRTWATRAAFPLGAGTS